MENIYDNRGNYLYTVDVKGRKNIRQTFINLIINQIDISVLSDPWDEILKTVLEFTHRNNLYLSECKPFVNDGFLYINDLPVKRIASRIPKNNSTYDEKSYYYEGKLLA